MRIDELQPKQILFIGMVIAAIIFAVILGAGIINAGFSMNPDEIEIVRASILDGRLHIFGYAKQNGLMYVDHAETSKGDSLYIRLSFKHRLKRSYRNGNFEIDINLNGQINKAYIQGNNEDDVKLIWQRDSGQ